MPQSVLQSCRALIWRATIVVTLAAAIAVVTTPANRMNICAGVSFWPLKQRIDSLLCIDRIEPADPTEAREPAEANDKMEPTEPTDNIEPAEPTDITEPADATD